MTIEIENLMGLTLSFEHLPADHEYRVYFKGPKNDLVSLIALNELRKMLGVVEEEVYLDGETCDDPEFVDRIFGYVRIPYDPNGEEE